MIPDIFKTRNHVDTTLAITHDLFSAKESLPTRVGVFKDFAE
jgi:hypothetical protein